MLDSSIHLRKIPGPVWIALHVILIGVFFSLCLEAAFKLAGGEGLCRTEGCEVAGTFVRGGEVVLVIAGAAYFLILWLLLFIGQRLPRVWRLWQVFMLALFAGLAFDGAILGFQFYGIGQKCALCLVVGASMFTVLLLYGLGRRNLALVVFGAAVWAGSFSGMAMMNFVPRTPPLDQCYFYSVNEDMPEYPEYYFLFSVNCNHCREVLKHFAINNPLNIKLRLVVVDTREEELAVIARFLQDPDTDKNPFATLFNLEMAKEKQEIRADVGDGLKQTARNALAYFLNCGFDNVPILLVRESEYKTTMLTGSVEILEYMYVTGALDFMKYQEFEMSQAGS